MKLPEIKNTVCKTMFFFYQIRCQLGGVISHSNRLDFWACLGCRYQVLANSLVFRLELVLALMLGQALRVRIRVRARVMLALG